MVRKNGIFCLALVVGVFSISSALNAAERQATRPATVTYSIGIKGLTCETCSAHAQKGLAAVPGVVKSSVDWKAGHAWVTVQKPLQRAVSTTKPRRISTELAAAIKRAGYKPTVNYVLTVKGMTCEACSKHITAAVAKVPGVAAVSVNYKGGYAVVVPSAKSAPNPKLLLRAVEDAGYKAVIHTGP